MAFGFFGLAGLCFIIGAALLIRCWHLAGTPQSCDQWHYGMAILPIGLGIAPLLAGLCCWWVRDTSVEPNQFATDWRDDQRGKR
jgi:hypothetical protein